MTDLYIGTQNKIYKHMKEYGCSGYDEDLLRRKVAEAPVWHQRALELEKRLQTEKVGRKELTAFRDEFITWCHSIEEHNLAHYVETKNTLAYKVTVIRSNMHTMPSGNQAILDYIEKLKREFAEARERTRVLEEQEDYLERCLKILDREAYLEVLHGNPKGSVADILPLKSKEEILKYLPGGYDYPKE